MPSVIAEDLEAVALAINNRPRKCLDWRHSRRSVRGATTLAPTSRCCIDRLNLVSTRPGPSATGCATAGLLASMGRVASILDNTMIESFWSSMQRDLLDSPQLVQQGPTRLGDLRVDRGLYYPVRRHSGLDDTRPRRLRRPSHRRQRGVFTASDLSGKRVRLAVFGLLVEHLQWWVPAERGEHVALPDPSDEGACVIGDRDGIGAGVESAQHLTEGRVAATGRRGRPWARTSVVSAAASASGCRGR